MGTSPSNNSYRRRRPSQGPARTVGVQPFGCVEAAADVSLAKQAKAWTPTASRPRRGVSLLEVLISIMILTVGILSVIALFPVAQFYATRGLQADETAVLGRRAHRDFKIRGMDNPENWRTVTGAAATFNGKTPVCIDPLGIAFGNVQPFAGMSRFTLSAVPGGNQIMNQEHAQGVFLSQDDLAIYIPENGSLPLVQYDLSGKEIGKVGSPKGRLSDGRYSWMATIAPKPMSPLAKSSDQYILSIVVFRSRDFSSDGKEKSFPVTFTGGGYGGGAVTFGSGALAVSAGHWVMVTSPGMTLRWYRVENIGKGGTLATLAGPDWPGINATAVAVPRVVAVYEKIIRLKTSSLWSK